MDRRGLFARLDSADAGQEIRDRARELGALEDGHLFCLVSGNLGLDDMAQRFVDAESAMVGLLAEPRWVLAPARGGSDHQDVAVTGTGAVRIGQAPAAVGSPGQQSGRPKVLQKVTGLAYSRAFTIRPSRQS